MSQDNQRQFKTFEDFTNLYELSKTLRFELKPVGKTKNLIEEQKIFQKDKKVLDNYKIIKKYFDKLHKKFVKEALISVNLDFENYKKAYFTFAKKAKDDRKKELAEFEKQEVYLRKQIKNLFDNCAKKWKEEYNKKGVENKKDDIGILFEKEALDILKYEFTVDKNSDVEFSEEDGRKKNIFEFFKGFTTYFTNFHNSRKNFYKDDGTASAIPTRIINDNLRKFIENSDAYSHAYHKIDFTEEEKNIFNLNFYNQCFLQAGIDKYNTIIGGINSKINKYRQEKKEKMPFLKILYKQILEDAQKQETEQDNFIEIGGNEDVFVILEKFINHNENNHQEFEKIFNDFINYSDKYDLSKIYLANRFVNTISSKWFNGWELFGGLILEKLNEGKPKSKQKNKLPDFIPFFQIKEILESTNIKKEDLFREDVLKNDHKNKNAYEIFIMIWKKEFDKDIDVYEKNLKGTRAMMTEEKIYTNKKEKINGEEIEIQKEKIKNYSDSALAIYQIMKYFALEKGKKNLENDYEIDAEFYNRYSKTINEAKTWLYYNEFRNFLTKKPFSEDKIKLNFENGTLLDGWDKNKEKDNYGVILRKDDKYYLGLMLKKSNKIFDDKFRKEMDEDLGIGHYEKMIYKFLPDPKKMLPKVCFSKKGKDFFKPNEELLRVKEKEEFKINTPYFSMDSLHKIIDYYKECLKKYEDWQCFDFINIKDTSEYKKNIGEFYKDIEKNSWKVWFEKVSEKYVNGKVDNGELYLFQIYNKDFSKESSGNKNLHTIYFENIFKEENIKKPIIKLNGQAEIFFRAKSIDKEIKEKKKSHDIIKNKRYTEDKILFHCPIKLNFAENDNRINLKVNELLANNKAVNIIGIDRGEKHLAYYSIINQRGEIIDINSLNKINGIDYLEKLHKKEKNIDKQQESWQSIGKIKELKEGYISHVIKKICDLAISHNAIIVFEDLNSGFKRGRQKIKKQIYQKLELALINKLNYFTDKNKESGDAGHFLSAYQLASRVDNFKDIGKQTGIVFYTQANYTSTTCPMCGFRKNLYLKYSTIDNAQKIFNNLNIFYEAGKKRFAVKYNPRNFKDFEFAKNEYIVYADGFRLRWNNTNKKTEKFNPNEMILKLFQDHKINISDNIPEQIREKKFEAKFYQDLIFAINLIFQLRNTDSENNMDYIACPACGFNSNNGFQNKEFNGDANGAYNIARKGIMVLDKINRFKNKKEDLSKLKWKDLIVKIEEWDKFVQK